MKHDDKNQKLTVGFAFCGSFCTLARATEALVALLDDYRIIPIFSEKVQTLDTRFGKAAEIMAKIEALCERRAIRTIVEAERIGPEKLFDILVIAPCTGNTLSKIALGITDGTVPMAAKAHLRNARPLLIAPASNDALSAGLKNLGALAVRKNVYFVPFGQDDPFLKPTSLVADFAKLPEALKSALDGKQLQPILLRD